MTSTSQLKTWPLQWLLIVASTRWSRASASTGLVEQRTDRETHPLVEILVIGLDHENLVPVSDFLDKAADGAALCLQTPCLGDVQLHVRDSDVRFTTQNSANPEAGGSWACPD